ncbi:MAG: response regulator [Deltaproteobacteria bacterium]|jgi:CheY-like chemotaxis protein|nr:response regulator [Deltaproteobacteria bacterium]
MVKLEEDKLKALGLLAGSVAHDLNNILTGILGNISLLKVILKDQTECADYLEAIDNSAKKSAQITQQILEFVRGNVGRQQQVNLSALIKNIIQACRGTLSQEVKIVFHNTAQDFLVMGDETQLHQVVLNLIVNAQNALENEGTIDIFLEAEKLYQPLFFGGQSIPAGNYLRLTVTDTGSGMSEEVAKKIFEPFFTTKDKNGTGLGLAIVHNFIQAHNGLVRVFSRIGAGTSFQIYLPDICGQVATAVKSNIVADEAKPTIPKGQERILVVDDEDTVRTVLQKSLEFLGYTVDTALHGKDALERYAGNLSNYDLVILDMMMPQMSGEETFLKMREIYPQIKVILASGYSSDASTKAVLAAGAKSFIQKPFAIEELATEVRRCLDN